MFTQKHNGEIIRQVSSTFAEILIGRAVIQEYDVKKSGNDIIINRKQGKAELIYDGWDYKEEKALESIEHEQNLW